MTFESDGEQWSKIKGTGQWVVFSVRGPSWIGSKYNVSKVKNGSVVDPGSRYSKLADALASLKEHSNPPKKMHSYLSTGCHRFKL